MSAGTMAKKPQKRGRGRPPGQTRPTRPFSLRLTPEHIEALHRATAISYRSMTKEVILAIERHLAAIDLWPPPP
jgi:hypothetical protein